MDTVLSEDGRRHNVAIRTLSNRTRKMKDWLADVPPAGWNLPDPMPGTLASDLEGQKRRELENKLLEVERAIGRMTDMLHDEQGLKLFLRYLGTAALGVLVTISITLDKNPPWMLGAMALLLLVYGFMGRRQTDRAIVLKVREFDRERIVRALDQTKK